MIIGNGIDNPYTYDIARGSIPGASMINAVGRSSPTGASDNILWLGGTYSIPPAGGISMDVASSSVQDQPAGTGVGSVNIDYLDANLEAKTLTVILQGTTRVVIPDTISFVNDVYINTVGTGESAAGNVLIRAVGSGPPFYGYIAQGDNRYWNAIRRVPNNSRGFLLGLMIGYTSAVAPDIRIEMSTSEQGSVQYTNPFILVPQATTVLQNHAETVVRFPSPIVASAGSVISLYYYTTDAATIYGSWWGFFERA